MQKVTNSHRHSVFLRAYGHCYYMYIMCVCERLNSKLVFYHFKWWWMLWFTSVALPNYFHSSRFPYI